MRLGALLLSAPWGRRTLLRLARKICPNLLTAVEADVAGLRMELDLTRLPDRDYALGLVDSAEIDFLVQHCPEDGSFIDIGANIGFYALLLSSRRPRARVLAVEPVAENVARLRRNIALNVAANVEVCECALAEEETTKELMLNAGENGGGHSFIVSQIPFQGFEKRVHVRARTLEHVLSEWSITRLDVLKADVEGYEYPILRKFFGSAPKSLWPKAMVIEELGGSIEIVGASAVELSIAAGYHLVNHTNLNFFLVR